MMHDSGVYAGDYPIHSWFHLLQCGQLAPGFSLPSDTYHPGWSGEHHFLCANSLFEENLLSSDR